jgi:RNA polymerase sigma-70 factor (ECF subfamily)
MTERVRPTYTPREANGALTTGEEHEFVIFHERTAPILRRKAARLAADDRMLSEDLVQETYLRAIRRWADVRQLDESRQLGWVTVALTNVFGDVLRKRARSPLVESLEDGGAELTDLPTTVLMRMHYRRTLQLALTELDGRQREIFVLRLLGWQGADIARMLGISPVTVRWNMSKAWKRLNELPTIAQTRALLVEEG